MNLPILSYGNRILRQTCEPIQSDHPNLNGLIENMWETLYTANGCGLAAPQIGEPIRLFVVDSKSTYNLLDPEIRHEYFESDDTGITETFINARIINRFGELWNDEEGCLSLPGLSQRVKRPWYIAIEYYNKNFEKQIGSFGGTTARIIQHEYDHTNGILYIDHLGPLVRRVIDAKLKKIATGATTAKYPMVYPQ